MRRFVTILLVGAAVGCTSATVVAQTNPPIDPIAVLVGRLDLQQYKATIKSLTAFGDRLQGTDRNRRAVEWIEDERRRNGCTDIQRLTYDFQPPQSPTPPVSVTNPNVTAGGGRYRGSRNRTAPNLDPARQPDTRLRELNAEPSTPGVRQEVFCTKVGVTRPSEMYIVSAHMDGRGFGEAANDDASGTALVMELARVLSASGIETDRSIRFILWNNEESGLTGSTAYVAERQALQGVENPPRSGRYPEPKWLGVIQHDMMLFDHGMPKPDGTLQPEQRLEADVNVEFQRDSAMAAQSEALAWALYRANEDYATDYPAQVGPHMTNTDSTPFMNLVPAISIRENERGPQIGAGWDPHWHQPTDLLSAYTDKDFLLGLNAAQTTLAAVMRLAGVRIRN